MQNTFKIEFEDVNLDFNGFIFPRSTGQPHITTKVDIMSDLIIKYGKIDIRLLYKLVGLEKSVVNFYLESFERQGLVEISTGIFSTYITATRGLIAMNRKDLVEYVNQCLENKIAVKKIKENLIQAGWKGIIVDCIISG